MTLRRLRAARERALRLVCSHVRANFPFESRREEQRFQEIQLRYTRRIPTLPNDSRSFFALLEQLLTHLKNSHTKLGQYPEKVFFRPREYTVATDGKSFYLVHGDRRCLGRVVAIDGQTPAVLMRRWARRISGASRRYRLWRSTRSLLLSDHPVPVHVQLSSTAIPLVLKRTKTQETWPDAHRSVAFKTLRANVGYLRIRSWRGGDELGKRMAERLDAAVAYFARRKPHALIVDVRGNEGGDASLANRLAGHFFDQAVPFGTVRERTARRQSPLRARALSIAPRKPYIPSPVIALIDRFCFSTNEYFIAGLKDTGRAFAIGETTAGGSGNPLFVTVPFLNDRFTVSISRWKYFRPNGKPLEGNGIAPDLKAATTRSDFCSGRDPVLTTAIRQTKRLAKRASVLDPRL